MDWYENFVTYFVIRTSRVITNLSRNNILQSYKNTFDQRSPIPTIDKKSSKKHLHGAKYNLLFHPYTEPRLPCEQLCKEPQPSDSRTKAHRFHGWYEARQLFLYKTPWSHRAPSQSEPKRLLTKTRSPIRQRYTLWKKRDGQHHGKSHWSWCSGHGFTHVRAAVRRLGTSVPWRLKREGLASAEITKLARPLIYFLILARAEVWNSRSEPWYPR